MSINDKSREKRLNAMKYKILKAEQENLRTTAKRRMDMIDTIKNIIYEEARKNY